MAGLRHGRLAGSAAVALLAGASVLSGCGSAPAKGVQVSVFHLRPGACVVTPTQVKAQLSKLEVVPCRQPHTEEVYALVVDHAGDTYPGSSTLQNFANGACLQRYAGYVGVDYRDSSLFFTYLLPSVRSWAAGDHTVDCVISTTGQTLTRSVKGSKLWTPMGEPAVHMGAMLLCSFGMAPATLNVLPDKMVMIEGTPAATITDCEIVNVPTFGMCTSLANPEVASATAAALGVLTPMPCVPMLTPWTPGSAQTLIGDLPALVAGSQCQCAYGGVVQISFPGTTHTLE